ncbi:JAB domain-containing protein [Sphingomonas hankyongi]|uniref:DNA repair protein n=1 Tax=Sphingomonas hankyongi TaxID=2908209 RepID=A0ABT0RZ21_9SPHN|nr:JAB domain-containing protein [Sphingomonas hankyongi]MCL6728802.1 DNA repair protein [Sphingomonas hankyongi]
MRYQRAEPPLKLDGLSVAQSFFAACFSDADPSRERLIVAHLDDEARCLHLSQHQGDETGTSFPLREIVVDAAIHGSAGIVLAHNHPSGDATPGDSDCRATRRLAAAVQALDCAVIDHLIFAGGDCTSLRSMGLL